MNRMKESLHLFDEICNSKWFEKTSIILFLNKHDLFQEKIKRVDLNVCFPEYTGGCDEKKALDFVIKEFLKLNKHPDHKQVPFRVLNDLLICPGLPPCDLCDGHK